MQSVKTKSDEHSAIRESGIENGANDFSSQNIEEIKNRLNAIAREITAYIPPLDTPQGKDVLSSFIADLMVISEQTRRERLHRRQMEGIAAAKAKGVHFGRASRPLPDNFNEMYQEWREGRLSMRAAAKACGMPHSSFAEAVKRELVNSDDSGKKETCNAKN